MSSAHVHEPLSRKPLRVWPGVAAATLLLLAKFAVPRVIPGGMVYGFFGTIIASALIVLWWLLFSRARWVDRLGAFVLMVLAVVATKFVVDKSIATGAMGFLFPVLAIPTMSLAFVVWAVTTRRLSDGLRRVTMAATILLACGVWALVRTGGFDGSFSNDLHWRWTKTAEQRMLAEAVDEPAAPEVKAPTEALVAKVEPAPVTLPPAPAAPAIHADWPGFRGPDRASVVSGVRIATDWSASRPVEMWHRAVGPAWSSFAVRGDRMYTQEQRGEDEVVSCYSLITGKPVWRHRDATRFWESNAGAGPRATPTLGNDRVYTLGGTGILNALDARDGRAIWSHNAVAETDTKIPMWGISGSPLLVGDAVIAAVSGGLGAYDQATGARRWFIPGGQSHSSPQLVTIAGVQQVVLATGASVIGVAPGDGTVLWRHPLKGYPIVQPAQTPDGDLLLSVSEGGGLHRLAVAHGSEGWTVQERWKSMGLKPYFNDFVIHKGHAYGFDGNILACIELQDGKRVWKGGRYGNGQLVLLPDQDLLLLSSEDGEVALVKATPDQYTEVGKFTAIEGKTWNHPVLAGDVLLVRNSEQMAAFRLALARP